jgi:hypothetical protein
MTTGIIWVSALAAYAVFWYWYVGFRPKITPQEVATTMRLFDGHSVATPAQLEHIRHFLVSDDGKDFVMVNLLHIKEPVAESRKMLATYQKAFMGPLLRRAGHPILMARAAAGNIENVACDHTDGWTAAGLIRYRSRRDFMEILPATVGSVHHGLKLAGLQKTFAFPASSWYVLGGPRIVVALVIALIAALLQSVAGS